MTVVATIKLQLDDQTGPGWAQFIENVRKAEQQAEVLQRALDMHTAVAEARQENSEILGLANSLRAAADAARTLNGCLPGASGPVGSSPPVQSPLATTDDRDSDSFDHTPGTFGEADHASIGAAALAGLLQAPAAERRQQFQQVQLASLVSGQGLESEQVRMQNELLQAATTRARSQQKVDQQIVQMLSEQIELEQQQQQAAEKTGQLLERLQAALITLLSASNNGAQQQRAANQGGP